MAFAESLHPATAARSAPLLSTKGLTKRFGGVLAMDGLDFDLRHGEICGVIGPNGAGKSTLVGLLGGVLSPTQGSITFNGTDITALPAPERARAGIGRTYQIPRPFPDMSVEENLLTAQFSIAPFIGRRQAFEQCHVILERTGLADAARLPARALPLLRRKRLELARALALKPKLLLLDEVGAGLIDSEVSELIELVHRIAGDIDAIIIVEHVMRVVKECCQRLVVLNFGRLFVDGPTSEVLANDDVAAVYLGTSHRNVAPAVQAAEAAAAETIDAPSLGQSAMLREIVGGGASTGAGKPLLELQKVCAGYGLARVLADIDLTVAPGQAIAILGTNGAGKTTLANVLNGTVKPTSGHLLIDGADVTGRPAHEIAGLGLTQCMEGRRIFTELSVEENLLVAARRVARPEQQRRLDIVYGLFPILHERRATPGVAMSGGQQQMLAIGRALMAKPRLVVFDEISLGLAPVIVDRLYEALRELRSAGLTMLVVEQDVDRALDLVDYVHVLEQGRFALSGTPAQIRGDARLRHLYVGEAE
jgi:ABC-type branched-subunit amino acid transport system ATPase component